MVVRDQGEFQLANTALKWKRGVTAAAGNAAVSPGCVTCKHAVCLIALFNH